MHLQFLFPHQLYASQSVLAKDVKAGNNCAPKTAEVQSALQQVACRERQAKKTTPVARFSGRSGRKIDSESGDYVLLVEFQLW